ncbi:hypothetical protein F0562_006745 [Nyssa sinensis]|uniref:Uncharacterized protein n=1 Tax=Nyssa sinensis TaxID=561372 RepID=A0A5J5AMB7_9ASTE|nr:hypothetical protein F0562_006745 [Nyssa sinensis]
MIVGAKTADTMQNLQHTTAASPFPTQFPNNNHNNSRIVAFTTPQNYAARLSGLLQLKGWKPLWCPTVIVETTSQTKASIQFYLSNRNPNPKDDDERKSPLEDFSAIAFTSRTGISAFSEALADVEKPPLAPSGETFTISALGKDSECLDEAFISRICYNPERIRVLVPPLATPTGLVESLGLGRGRRVLCPVPLVVGLEEPPVVPNFLRDLAAKGWVPVRVNGYETRWAGPECVEGVMRKSEEEGLDAIVFTSTGEVEGLLKSLREFGLDWRTVRKRCPRLVVAAHGPVTASGAESLGIGVDVVSRRLNASRFHNIIEEVEGLKEEKTCSIDIEEMSESNFGWLALVVASNGDDYDSDGSNFAPPTPTTLSMAIPAELAGAIPLIDKFQVEGFLRAMQKQIQSAAKRGFFSKRSVGPQVQEKFTFEDMLCFQKDPIPTSLLKINSDLVSRAIKMFQNILKYMGVDSSDRVTPVSLEERIKLVGKLYKQALKRSELRDELFVQISKQTRNNPDRQFLIKAWELMYLCASCMPPYKDLGGYLSEYVHNVAHGVSTDSEVQSLALNTLNALKCSVKAGPRHTIPGREEIEALLTGKRLTTIVFFLDETFEEITYDMVTTVADAVEDLAGIIKLSVYSSFSLFECRKVVTGSKSPDPGNEGYIGLDDNKYIADLLAEFKAAKDRSKGEILHCKLTFKKKLFRESDEAVGDPMFVQLCYVQLQHDYILGNYPVGRDDAAQLSALQILVDIGFVVNLETCTDWTSLLERFLPRQIAITRAKQEWELDILSRYRSMENLTKDDARQQFLQILRTLPYGNSVFFSSSQD